MSPNQVGWGGYFEWGAGPDTITNSYNNHNGQAKKISGKYEEYFYPIIFNDFSARMDWAKNGKGNLNPVVIINNQEGINPVEIDVRQEHELILDATNSYDPDNDELNYKWWYLKEAGSYKKSINIINTEGKIAKIILPPDFAIGDDIHIICEITDNGTPNLSGFRRIIITKTE